MPLRPALLALCLVAGPGLADGSDTPLPDTPEALAEGAEIFERRCSQCHGMDSVNYRAPWLNGILDRPAASVPGWNYSEAMQAWGEEWSVENLRAWLTRPNHFIPDNDMNFGGFRGRTEDRDKVIAWMIAQPSEP